MVGPTEGALGTTSSDFVNATLVQIQNAKIVENRNPKQSFRVAGPFPTYADSILIDNAAGATKFATTP